MGKINPQQEKYEQIDQKAYDMFQEGMSLVKIAKELKVDRPCLTERLKKRYGIKPQVNGQQYSANYNFFEKIDTEEKAYWLGFLIADGHNSGRAIELSLKEEDRGHLEKFKQAIEATHPIADRKQSNSNRFYIANKKMCEDLAKLNCYKNKTLDVSMPTRKIPYYLRRHFLRGIFDGDGCIAKMTKESSVSKKRLHFTRKIPSLSITTGSPEMAKDLQKLILSYAKVETSIAKDKRTKAIDIMIQGNDKILKFLNYIYLEAEIFLDRKFYQYLQYVLPSGVETVQIINGEKIWNPVMGIRGEGAQVIEPEDSDVLH